jgi:hypothetical protein
VWILYTARHLGRIRCFGPLTEVKVWPQHASARPNVHHENGLDVPPVEFACSPAACTQLGVSWYRELPAKSGA